MDKETQDALIGQLAADAALLHGLAATVIGTFPELRTTAQTQVEAAALLGKQSLSASQRAHFEDRLADLRAIFDAPDEPP